ncbi:hypothetical protein JOS77_16655 [Chromobacterium haemolyticum]|nr:hypothetical protein JOS77_16655 [Chromobacterium haemolyticum]
MVACQVAEIIVDVLEVVDVQQQHGEGPSGTVGALGFAFQDGVGLATVGQAGDRVLAGDGVELLQHGVGFAGAAVGEQRQRYGQVDAKQQRQRHGLRIDVAGVQPLVTLGQPEYQQIGQEQGGQVEQDLPEAEQAWLHGAWAVSDECRPPGGG